MRRCPAFSRAVLAALLIAAAAGCALAAEPAVGEMSQDMRRSAGPQAAHILDLWNLTVWICTAVFAAVMAALAWALWHSPRSRANTPPDVSGLQQVEPGPRRSVVIAVGASTVLLFVLLAASIGTDRRLAKLALDDAVHIDVTAHQWWWSARYHGNEPARMFDVANELHIPVGRPVVMTLHSEDVIHSLWVPNLSGKKDLIPGRTATLTLRADRAGVYRGQCAEFCGAQHAWMAFNVTADTPAGYEAWAARQREAASAPTEAAAAAGRQVFLRSSCVMCHTVRGTDAGANHAPDLTHLAGRATLGAGTLPNDAAHLAAWITDPSAFKPGVHMPGQVYSSQDLQSLVTYLRSLH